MNTTGFKRQRAEFQDLIYQNLERPGATTSEAGTIDPTGVQVGYGVKTGSVYRVTEQGSLTRTDNAFDLAINGRGYFQIAMPDGVFYKGMSHAPAYAIIEQHHLDSWLPQDDEYYQEDNGYELGLGLE